MAKKGNIAIIVILIVGAIFILPKLQQTFVVSDFTCDPSSYAQTPGNYDCFESGYTTCKLITFQDPEKSSRCYQIELAYNFNPSTNVIDYYMYYSRNLWIYQSPNPLASESCALGELSTPGSEVTCTGEIVSSYSSTTSPNPHTGSILVSPSSRYFNLVAADKGHPSTNKYYGAILAISFERAGVCSNADVNCDGIISRDELGVQITKWTNNQITRDELGMAISSWAQ